MEEITIRFPQDLYCGEKDPNNKEIHYCPFCGKQMKHSSWTDHYEDVDVWSCDCEDYKKARQIMLDADRLSRQMPRTKYKVDSKPYIREKSYTEY